MAYRVKVPGKPYWEGDTAYQIRTGKVFTRKVLEAREYATEEEARAPWRGWSRMLIEIEAVGATP